MSRANRTYLGAMVGLAAILMTVPFISSCGEEKSQGETAFQANCASCHSVGGAGGTAGPMLDHVGGEFDSATIAKYITNPQSVNPNSKMPPITNLSDSDVQAIADYLATRK